METQHLIPFLFGTASLRKRSRNPSFLFNNRERYPNKKTEKLLSQHLQESPNHTSYSPHLGFFRCAWRLIKPYWFDNFILTRTEKVIAWSLLITSLGLTYYQVNEVAVGLNEWKGMAGDAIQDAFGVGAAEPENATKAWRGFFALLTDLCILTVKLLLVGAINYKATQYMILRWRRSITENLTERWMKNKAFYYMQCEASPLDNPDQRIHEDPEKFADAAIDIATDAFDTTLSFVTFSGILWHLSNDFDLANVGGPEIVIPRFMFWLVMGYAALGTAITHIASKPLEKRAQEQQKYSATFRSDLIHVREKAELIAQNDSEQVHKDILRQSFDTIYQNYKIIINIKISLLLLRILYHRLANVMPLIVTFPEVIYGNMKMGGVLKVSGAFGEIKSAMSWYVTNAVLVRQTKATMNRLIEFDDALSKLEKGRNPYAQYRASGCRRSKGPVSAL